MITPSTTLNLPFYLKIKKSIGKLNKDKRNSIKYCKDWDKGNRDMKDLLNLSTSDIDQILQKIWRLDQRLWMLWCLSISNFNQWNAMNCTMYMHITSLNHRLYTHSALIDMPEIRVFHSGHDTSNTGNSGESYLNPFPSTVLFKRNAHVNPWSFVPPWGRWANLKTVPYFRHKNIVSHYLPRPWSGW